MNPEQAIDFALKFTGPISPWWLLLLLPVALGAAWTLYRRELPVVDRPHRIPLLLLRLTMLGIVVLLVFQPQLVRRLTLTYNGRTVFVLDDSRSMAARDSRLGDAAALRLARSLRPGPSDDDGEAEADPLVVLIGHLEAARSELRSFQRFAADADRARDAFWDRVDQSRSTIDSAFDEAGQLIETTSQVADGLAEELQILRESIDAAREAMPGLFTGQTAPPTERYDAAASRIDAAIDAAITAQAGFDRLRIAAGDEARADLARRIRSTPRFELVKQRLAALPKARGYELIRLSDAAAMDWPTDNPDNTADGAEAMKTNLVGAIDRVVETPNEFPLQSIVLLSDGRDTSDRSIDPVIGKLARMGVPIIGAGAGAVDEPIDLAVTDITAAPIAVAGQPMTIRVGIKSAPAEQITGKLSLVDAERRSLQEKQIDLPPGRELLTDLKLTAEEPGLKRLTVTLDRVENEAFPVANNTADLVVNVLEQPLRVLMVDHRPRWQTRFILNILKRLPYVDLNAIVLTTRPEGQLKRGVERGMWPEDETALGTYDMVILGDLPEGTLTPAERDAIDRLVRDGGKTLLTLGPTREQPLERLAHLAVTTSGAVHPVTMPLAKPLGKRENDDRRALLVDNRDGQPLLTCRFDGEGRRIALDSDRLWKPLNPRHLVGHTRMFVELFTWSVESGRFASEGEAAPEQQGPRLILDQRRNLTDAPLVVGAEGYETNEEGGDANPGEDAAAASVTAMLDDGVVAEAPIRNGAARFDELPPGAIRFKFADHEAPLTPTVQVVERTAELDRLARDADWLASVSKATGGRSDELAALDRLLTDIEPRQRVERDETVYRLWDATLLMALLVVGLTVEWVWRKLTGLV